MDLIEQKPKHLNAEIAETLYQQYPERINDLYYHDVILNERSVSRPAYRRIAKKILAYAKFGDPVIAKAWIKKLQQAYPRRWAMISELDTALAKLSSD
ncbi:hypothetical protein ACFQ22_04155 [Lentilactobacillus raoultii]|uniref:Uncharacterized protein n=2 Tax=Lentilactobacillus raoultii TaxID=1987503 RepID=A0ABW3PL12_9LACO|nr:hypothetical protein [Lentilactobacillus raoultii]